MSNDMTGSPGRLCNHIIRAHAASFLAKKGNIRFCYGEYTEEMKRLGIPLFTEGEHESHYTTVYNERTFYFCMVSPAIDIRYNINLNHCYCQTRLFSRYLYQHYQQFENRQPIMRANLFQERYMRNQDVFVHVRLGDVEHFNPGYAYYETCLSSLLFHRGYLASDSPNHPIC